MIERATYTVAELAERWQCKPDRVRELIARGTLAAFAIDPARRRKQWRIPIDAVEAHETQNAARPIRRISRRRERGTVPQRY